MTFDMPAAWIAALALPILWWLHRRRSRPTVVQLPSLMFLLDEQEQAAFPRARIMDRELLLTLCAAAALVVAAVGPSVVRTTQGRRVHVVVAGGAALGAAGANQRMQDVLDALRAQLDDADELEVEQVPPGLFGPRPAPDSLVAAARAAPAEARFVLSDRAAPQSFEDVQWIGIGDPTAVNVGIVAASLRESEGALRLFLNLHCAGGEARSAVLRVVSHPGTASVVNVDLRPGRYTTAELAVDPRASRVAVTLQHASDALAADDAIELVRDPLSLYLDPALRAELVARVRLALVAVLGESGVAFVPDANAPSDLAVLSGSAERAAGAQWTLRLGPSVTQDGAVERSLRAPERWGEGLARDLSTGFAQWVVSPTDAVPQPDEEVLLATRFPGGAWPLLLLGGQEVRLSADALGGDPAPVDTPFWPLLIENIVRAVGGVDLGVGGWRARGLLDADSSSLGAHATPVPALVAAVGPPRPSEPRHLRTPFAALGALLLAWLWLRPARPRRRARGRSDVFRPQAA